ncbi:hypothetical protein RSAG8_03151, partial [Rhizoctonia solani AG-8 WAC10335]
MDYERMLASAASRQGGHGAAGGDQPMPDNGEVIHISSLALLKMLKHGRAGVPMEVMGLMLGEFVDDYTVQVIDVFAMPQSGTSVTVESVDHVFQTRMVEMLKQTGRPEMVVGWYHSHPGFGCWLSSVDINTQSSFERLNARSVAVVIDPIQSVKGKVVIDAFRLINPHSVVLGQEPPPDDVQHWTYQQAEHTESDSRLEQAMLMNLHKRNWTEGLRLRDFAGLSKDNEGAVKRIPSRWKKNPPSRLNNSRRGMSENRTRNDTLKTRSKRPWATRSCRVWERCCWPSCRLV